MKLNPKLINYFLLNAKKYFIDADEFVNLGKTFINISWWTILDMIFPIVAIIHCIVAKSLPDIFFVLSVYKSIQLWIQWSRFYALKRQISEWREIVNATGGPFISTNDPTYLPYVFADGMQRLQELHIRRRTGSVPA
jgi:hypothetical protein